MLVPTIIGNLEDDYLLYQSFIGGTEKSISVLVLNNETTKPDLLLIKLLNAFCFARCTHIPGILFVFVLYISLVA